MRGLSILVVDDEPGIRELLSDTLADHGHRVTCATNGLEAVACLAEERADVVLLDYRMRGGDGLTALATIRQRWPSLPVVMITGYGHQELTSEAFALGAFACLVKPFSIGDVTSILETLEAADYEAA